jgi:hypothetical protein
MTRPLGKGTLPEVVIFGLLAVGNFGGGLIYGLWSHWEETGVVLLWLSAGLALITAGYLAFQVRLARSEERAERAGQAGHEPGSMLVEEPFLPHESVWPLELGAGMTLALCGFVLGLWVLVPGLVLTAHAMLGWTIQSRVRR